MLESAHERVLIVDDNVDNAQLTEAYLSSLGHEVAIAHDGSAGLELVDKFKPTVLLVDIGLPIVDGFEVARRLRASHGETLRLIAVTGYGQRSDRELGRDAGFDEYLVKPIDLDVLARTVIRTP